MKNIVDIKTLYYFTTLPERPRHGYRIESVDGGPQWITLQNMTLDFQVQSLISHKLLIVDAPKGTFMQTVWQTMY